uniref:Uncharacterized protein n=1 Tax=Amphimedon queenslandica TaxID=400682 RepID=A0A1X7TE25_AMPQE
MLNQSLPQSYKDKELRKKLSEKVEFLRLPHPFSGCYKPFEKCLIESLQHLLHQGITFSSPIEVKLSGDGAPFYRSTFILLSFSFPSIDPTAISATGTHTLGVLEGAESYDSIKYGFAPCNSRNKI